MPLGNLTPTLRRRRVDERDAPVFMADESLLNSISTGCALK